MIRERICFWFIKKNIRVDPRPSATKNFLKTKNHRDFLTFAGGFSELVPNHQSDAPPTTAINKISPTIAARIAILTAFRNTKNVIAAVAIKKITKTTAAISIY